jgi:hypothetical protein
MSDIIYTKRNHYFYRSLWEENFGPIPKDENGISYEIHHIDGDKTNNDIKNLKCVSLREHYDIHYQQKDWGVCFLIAKRMKLSKEEISELASKAGKISSKKLLKNGNHNFLKKDVRKKIVENSFYKTERGKERRKILNKIMYENKTNNFYDSESCKKRMKKILDEGRHNLKNGVTCRDIEGNVVQIDREIYWSQKGNKESWEFVSINSQEGKKRKNNLIQE